MPQSRRHRINVYVPEPLFEAFHRVFPRGKSTVLTQMIALAVSMGEGHRFIDHLKRLVEEKYGTDERDE